MARERTFSIIKPDATRRNLTGAVNERSSRGPAHRGGRSASGMTARPGRRRSTPSTGAARSSATSSKFMTSGPVVVQVLEGENAVAKTAR